MKKNRFIPALMAVCAALLAGCPGTAEGPDDEGPRYTVTVDPGLSGGAITAEPSEGPQGTVIQLTLSPREDYDYVPGTLKYRAGEKETLINAVTRSFKLPAADVTVSASFNSRAVYTVTIDPAVSGILSAEPLSATAGTQIRLILDPAYRLLPGTLKHGTTTLDIGRMTFYLPEGDVTVTAQYELWDDLLRRMIKVEGATVSNSIGVTSINTGPTPFYTASDAPVTVDGFSIAAVEVTRHLWNTVKTWAQDQGYTFTTGTAAEETEGELQYHPVYGASWWDMVVWCNAYSEYAKAKLGDDFSTFDAVYKRQSDSAPLKNSTFEHLLTFLGVVSGTGGTQYPDISKLAPVPANAPGFRLPTEAEWEFAARGGDPQDAAWHYLYAGSNNINAVAWYSYNSELQIHDPANLAPNTLGLYDMSGNIREAVMALSNGSALYCGGFFNTLENDCYIVGRIRGSASALGIRSLGRGFRVAGPPSIGISPP